VHLLAADAVPSLHGMGASPDRLTPAQKDLVYELKRQGKSGKEVKRIASMGHEGVDPFRISASHANEIYRLIAESRGELYTTQIAELSTDAALDKLQARLLRLAEREIARQETKERSGRLDAVQVGKLATALERIHKLSETRAATAKPARTAEDAAAEPVPSSFAEQLAEGDETVPAADVVLTEARGVPGPKPKQSAPDEAKALTPPGAGVNGDSVHAVPEDAPLNA
jgi:hypothetical protein